MEQGIISNSDGWRPGLIQEEEDSQAIKSHKEQEVQITDTLPGIRRIVEGNPKRFKTELALGDKIDMTRIHGYKNGVRLDIDKKAKLVANYFTHQVPVQYAVPAQTLNQDLISAEI